MTVKRRVTQSIESFIDKGARVKSDRNGGFRNILVRVPTGILDDLDLLLGRKTWLNRTQLIIESIHEKLIKEGV